MKLRFMLLILYYKTKHMQKAQCSKEGNWENNPRRRGWGKPAFLQRCRSVLKQEERLRSEHPGHLHPLRACRRRAASGEGGREGSRGKQVSGERALRICLTTLRSTPTQFTWRWLEDSQYPTFLYKKCGWCSLLPAL